MKNLNNQHAPAYPCTPMQDNFGRIIAAKEISGITKLEYFTLQIYCAHKRYGMYPDYKIAIEQARELLEQLDDAPEQTPEQDTKIINI